MESLPILYRTGHIQYKTNYKQKQFNTFYGLHNLLLFTISHLYYIITASLIYRLHICYLNRVPFNYISISILTVNKISHYFNDGFTHLILQKEILFLNKITQDSGATWATLKRLCLVILAIISE